MIQISVDTRRAVVTNKELLTVGSAGIQVQFTLSEDWESLAKLAVFRVGDEGEKVDVVIDSELVCTVPSEVLQDEGEVLFIGIYGANGQGTIIIPTIWASAGLVKPGTVPNTPADAQPTPEIWAQILEVAQDAEQTAGDAMSMVEAGLASLTELEEGVEDAETVRAANELTRISNEEDRGIAETSRATAETGRANSETSRAAAEAGRVWKNNNFLVNGVSVTTLTPSTPATASLETTTDSTTGETAVTRLLLGIPQGAKGDQGDPGETLVSSVNGKTGAVVLDASDVGAYEKPETGIPATDLTSAAQTSLGKADSAYQKPAGGIPATDLASAVQTSLGKADTALQTAPVSSVAGKTGAVALDAGDIEFDDQETYAAGSVGAELSSQLNAISQKQDAPSSAGTAGQVLGLDSNLDPVWVNQSGSGGDVSNCAPIIINTASGNIASFADGADNRQIRKIVGTIVTPEGGSGWTGCKIYGRKANIATFSELLPRYGTSSSGVNLTVSNGKMTFSGTATAGGAKFFGSFPTYAQRVFPVKAGVTYCVSSKNTGNAWIQGNIAYDDGTTSSGWIQVDVTSGGRKYRTFTPGKNGRVAFLPVANLTSGQEFSATIEDIQLTPEVTAVYKGEAGNIILPINWQDAAGTILNGSVTLNEDESADVVNSDSGNSYHLTNVGSLNTYLGTNNVWIDTGAITECDYPADTKLYIDGLTAPDEDMIADGLIASGKYFTVNNQLYLSTAQIAAGAQIIPGSNCTATSITEALNALNT